MNFKQYVDEKRALYSAFADVVRTIIETTLDCQPSIARPQQIQTRAKTPTSLARKLRERGLERSRSLDREIKDLAGVRLIFYTNTDERSFLNSRIINDNFHIDYDASKVHHPVGTPADVNEQYRGIHYVLTLKEDRLKLPEYSRFAGLRCEIQIQTILNHAWSETSHDILYHRPDGAAGFGTRQYERIHKRMSVIMEKYLVPAGHEFEKVHHDFQGLMAGQALFDQGMVKVLKGAADNNERYDILRRITKDVLPQHDDVTAIASELRTALIEVIQQARQTDTKSIDVGPGFGTFPGKSEADVTEAAIEIMNKLRYIDIAATFKALLALYPGAKSDEERQHILEAIKKLAEYNLTVWRKAGSFVQDTLIQEVFKLEPAIRLQNRQIIQCVCENVLKAEIRGVSSETYDTVSIHTGAVVGTDKLGETRERALEVALDLYVGSSSPAEKRECYAALSAAMTLPNVALYGEPLWLLANRDTKTILEFFAKRGVVEPHGILQDLESRCLQIFQNAVGVRKMEPKQENVVASYDDLLSSVDRFRALINSDETYQKHKTFVGYRPIFEDDLSKEDFNWRRRDAVRNARMTTYLGSINETTKDQWLKLIIQFSAERDSYQHLARFCEMVGSGKSGIALDWLKRANVPNHLRTALLFGVLASSERDLGAALMREWIREGVHLEPIARVVGHGKEAPEDLLAALGEKALHVNDIETLAELIPCLIRAGLFDASFTDTYLLPAIQALAKARRWRWLMQIFLDEQEQLFLEQLSETQAKLILKCLVDLPHIDYNVESFLKPIAKSYPSEVLNLFQQREVREKDAGEQYEAIPFDLHELHEPLANNPDLMINTMRAWHSADSRLFQFKGGRLLALVFPSFSESFGKALQALVKKDSVSIDFVLSVLQNYEGESTLHETFKVIINLLPEKDDRLSDIERALEATGVVSGEFGFVSAYQEKRKAIEPWLEDKRRVRKFAERYIRSLDRAIAAEQRRAETDLELRKHQFDPDAD